MHKRHPFGRCASFQQASTRPGSVIDENSPRPCPHTSTIFFLTAELGATLELLRQAHDNIEVAGSEGFHHHRQPA